MEHITERSTVEAQYKTAEKLNTRISIHDKYSTNREGFGNWICARYDLPANARVLELGCGTGDMWRANLSRLAPGARLVLTDLSQGMVNEAKGLLGERDNLSYQVVDIENIPYGAESFDRVIANMMLYHVPDLDKALSEVVRVLSADGYFYCATYGENGIVPYLAELLAEYGVRDNTSKRFTLQNGCPILSRYFSDVRRLDYRDSLAVTDPEDLLDYVYSLSSMTELAKIRRSTLKAVLERHMVNGVLNIPKEYGMFVCRK